MDSDGLTHCEHDAGVTFRIKVNFSMDEGELIIKRYKIINQFLFIVGMNDEDFAMFILRYGQG